MKSRINGLGPTVDIGGADSLLPTSAEYWRQRLVRRFHADSARPNSSSELFARIELEGRGSFFPLGSDAPRTAAAKAREIYLTAASEGWRAACRRYVRELTLAIFWLSDPVACTYATLFTRPEQAGRNHEPLPVVKSPGCTKVAMIEPEEETRRMLVHWLNQTSAFGCIAAAADAREILKTGTIGRRELVLCNWRLPGFSDNEFPRQLQERLPAAAVFSYGVFTNSDELFGTITEGDGSYFLRRRAPDELLEPVHGAWTAGGPSAGAVRAHVQRYFETLFPASPGRTDLNPTSELTDREHELLTCMSRGFSDNKAIAETLKISVWTVNTHLKRIYEKLGVHSRTDAVMKFLREISGFIDRQMTPPVDGVLKGPQIKVAPRKAAAFAGSRWTNRP